MITKRSLLGFGASILFLGILGFIAWNWYQTTRPEYRYARACEAIAQENFTHAEEIADSLEQSGNADWGNLLRGRSYLKQKRYTKALEAFNQIRDQGKLRIEAAFFTGEVFLGLSRVRDAEQAFFFVLTEDPDHVDTHRHLAALYYDQGDLPKTMGHLEEVIRLAPDDYRPHRLLGLVYRYLDQHKDAIEHYRQALSRNPPEQYADSIRLELGDSLLKLFQYEESFAAVEHVDHEEANLIRAEYYNRVNRLPEAYSEVDSGLTKNPKHPGLLAVKGKLYLVEAKAEEAVKVLEEAASLAPGDYSVNFQLASAYAQAGRKKDAEVQKNKTEELHKKLREVIDLSQVAMKDPWDPEPRDKLALLWEQLGNPDLAKVWRKAAQACRTSGRRPKN